MTPAIIPSLNPPFHIPESITASALTAFTQGLTAELAPLKIPVTHIKLGNFDTSSMHARNHLQSLQTLRAETLGWPPGAREIYGGNYVRMMAADGSTGGRSGSPLRELHNAVFDVMEARPTWFGRPNKGSVITIGRGSGLYAFVGTWLPKGLISRMMGMRAVNRTVVIEREEERDLSSSGEFISITEKDGMEQDFGRRYD